MHRLSRKLATICGLVGLVGAGLTTGVVTPASANNAPGEAAAPAGYTAITSNVCGTTISSPGNYALTNDIGPCTVNTDWGIRITAKNVTLDLNGHDILGCNNPDPSPGKCNEPTTEPSDGAYTFGEGPGILLENVRKATVTNSRATWNARTGTDTPGFLSGNSGPQDVSKVAFFDQGLAATNVGAACPDKSVTASAAGVNPVVQAHVEPDCGNLVEKIRFAKSIGTITSCCATGEGIVFDESGGNTITHNVVDHSGPYAGIAIYDDPATPCDTGPVGFTAGICSRGNKIVENTITDSNTQTNGGAFHTTGIRIEPRATYTQIVGNTVDNSSLNGIALFAFTSHNTVHNNVVTDNGFHYGTGGDKTPPTDGPADETGDPRDGDGSGPYERANHVLGDGIKLFASSNNNYVTNNVVCGNAGNGIYLQGPAGVVSGAYANNVKNNTVGGSIAGGTAAGSPDPGNGDCGTRVEHKCEAEDLHAHAVTGGQGCSKNNVGKDPRKLEEVPNANSSVNGPLNYDLHDRNPNCTPVSGLGANVWLGNTRGRNSWPAALSDPGPASQPEYNDRYFPYAPLLSCVVA